MDTRERQQLFRQRQAELGLKRLTLYVPVRVVRAIDKAAKTRGTSRDAAMVELLHEAIAARRREQAAAPAPLLPTKPAAHRRPRAPKAAAPTAPALAVTKPPRPPRTTARLGTWYAERGMGKCRKIVVVVAANMRAAAQLVGLTQRDFRLSWHKSAADAPLHQKLARERGPGVWEAKAESIRMMTVASFRPGRG